MSRIDFRRRFKNRLCKKGSTVFDNEMIRYSDDVIINNHGKLPKLYRYMPANYYNIRSIEKKHLFLAPAGELNDVFEGLSAHADKRAMTYLNQWTDLAFAKSFSEIPNSLFMWGLYGDSYKGICVEYDINRLAKNSTVFYHLFPVVYLNKRILKHNYRLSYQDLKDYKRAMEDGYFIDPADCSFLKDILGLFCVKSDQWAYEKEWRIAVSYLQMKEDEDPDDADLNALYEINSQFLEFDCISKISMGPRIAPYIRDHIIEIANNYNCSNRANKRSDHSYKQIRVVDMIMSTDTYELHEEEIR